MLVRGKLPALPSEDPFIENDNAIKLFTPFGVEKYCTFCVVQYNIVICLEQTSFLRLHGSQTGIFFAKFSSETSGTKMYNQVNESWIIPH